MKYRGGLLVVVLSACALAALGQTLRPAASMGGKAPLSPTSIDLTAKGWQTATTQAAWPLANDASGALKFTFPDEDVRADWFGYLYSRQAYDLVSVTTYGVTFDVKATSGTPRFVYDVSGGNVCAGQPANIWLFLQGAKNEDSEFGRWWHHPPLALAVGAFTLNADLNDLANWSSVYGKRANHSADAAAGFNTAKSSALVGVTFGGGCFAGHGVGTIGGKAEFRLIDIHRRGP